MSLHPKDALIKSGLSAEQTVAMTIWAESRAEVIEGQVAVGCVIRNRVLLPKRFDDTWKKVCLAKWQFSCWIPQGGEANYQMLMARCEAGLRGEKPWPAQALWIAEGIISGALSDRVPKCTHYMTKSLHKTGTVKWARGIEPAFTVGEHVFFRNVP